MSSLVRRITIRKMKRAGYTREKWILGVDPFNGEPKLIEVRKGGEITDPDDNPIGSPLAYQNAGEDRRMIAAGLSFLAAALGFIGFGGAMAAEESGKPREAVIAFLFIALALVSAFFAGRSS